MYNTIRILLTTLITWLVLGAGLAQAQGIAASQCGSQPIRMADQAWESAGFTTQLIRLLLIHGYGCNVEIVPGATAATESALVQDDLQIIAEQWTGRSPIIAQGVLEGDIQVVGDTLEGGAEQGWYVPDYVVHGDPARGIKPMAPELRTWRDLSAIKSLFADPEQPDKGRFLNCPTGWVCEQTNSRLLDIYGLDRDYTNFRAGTGAALDSAISAAYEQGEPILFYYWQPAGLMAKYDFFKIQQEPFDQTCWDAIVSGEGRLCPSDFLLARLGIAVSTPFAQQHPDLVDVFERLQFQPGQLNRAILVMNEERRSAQDVAQDFLRDHPDTWQAWLSQDAAARVATAQDLPDQASASRFFPDWSMASVINRQVMDVVRRQGSTFRDISHVLLTTVLLPVERGLQRVPAWLLLVLTGLLAWHATRRWTISLLYVAGLYLVGAVGLWDKLVQTFALVLVATLMSIVIGVPVGILGAYVRWLRRLLTPVLDVMQTLPSFVYLIPVLMLFGLGKVPALFATVIYAVPPLIRLTILGLRQVDRNITEAAQSFGVTPGQMLWRVTLPLARPSIMAGINQATMMALSMVVVASMIGARGLGEDVLAGIQTLDVGRGLQAGIAIVILAIVIDRITQAYGRSARSRRARAGTPGRRAPQDGAILAPSADPAESVDLVAPADSAASEPTATPDAGATAPSDVAIQVRDVYKVFGERPQQAVAMLREHHDKSDVQQRTGLNVGLAGVDLDLPAGKITCIMGLSGSGKSTLVRHLNRLIDPSAGRILLNGRDILTLSMPELRTLRRHTISMVFQNFGLLPHLTVVDNVAFGLRVRGEARAVARRTAMAWLRRVGLDEYAANYPDELSGGMRQRVGLARALAIDAQVILMDEAFSALDPLSRAQMQDDLLALQAKLHRTIVFITHDIDEALRLGQHLVILRDGRVEQAGTPDAIRNAPATDYVRGFIDHRKPGRPSNA